MGLTSASLSGLVWRFALSGLVFLGALSCLFSSSAPCPVRLFSGALLCLALSPRLVLSGSFPALCSVRLFLRALSCPALFLRFALSGSFSVPCPVRLFSCVLLCLVLSPRSDLSAFLVRPILSFYTVFPDLFGYFLYAAALSVPILVYMDITYCKHWLHYTYLLFPCFAVQFFQQLYTIYPV